MNRLHRPLIACAATAAAFAATSATAVAAPTTCPGGFRVLHDDHVGALPVPAGTYQLTADGVTCAQASSRFAQFLADYDGVLPKPWRVDGDRTFTSGAASFSFAPQTTPDDPDDGGGAHGALACSTTFRVLNDDRIGRLSVPRGRYRVTPLGPGLSCDAAQKRFARFLRDGRTGTDWTVLPSAEFVRSSTTDGFRIKPVQSGPST